MQGVQDFRRGNARTWEGVVLALLWIVLATAKTLRSESLTTFLASTTSLSAESASIVAGAIIGLEYVLGCLMLVGRFGRLAVGASLLASVSALGLALTVHPEAGCGCFGALGTAEEWQRLVLAGALLYLSLGAWPRSDAPVTEAA